MALAKRFEDMEVWKKGCRLSCEIFRLAEKGSLSRNFVLRDQICASGLSIPSNIAEGLARQSTIDFIRFLRISLGSLFEAQTQFELAKRLGYLEHAGRGTLSSQGREIERMLTALIRSLSARKAFRRRTDHGTNG